MSGVLKNSSQVMKMSTTPTESLVLSVVRTEYPEC